MSIGRSTETNLSIRNLAHQALKSPRVQRALAVTGLAAFLSSCSATIDMGRTVVKGYDEDRCAPILGYEVDHELQAYADSHYKKVMNAQPGDRVNLEDKSYWIMGSNGQWSNIRKNGEVVEFRPPRDHESKVRMLLMDAYAYNGQYVGSFSGH